MNRFLSTISISTALILFVSTAIAADSDKYYPTKEEIIKIQTNLIEGGWTIDYDERLSLYVPNGILDSNTFTAIKDALSSTYFEGSILEYDALKKDQFDHLIHLPSNSMWQTNFTWGAISATSDGNVTASWKYSSGIAAYNRAQSGCEKEFSSPCKTVTAFRRKDSPKTWLSAAWCPEEKVDGGTSDRKEGVGMSARPSPHEAEEAAKWQTYVDGFGVFENCKVLITISLDDGPV